MAATFTSKPSLPRPAAPLSPPPPPFVQEAAAAAVAVIPTAVRSAIGIPDVVASIYLNGVSLATLRSPAGCRRAFRPLAEPTASWRIARQYSRTPTEDGNAVLSHAPSSAGTVRLPVLEAAVSMTMRLDRVRRRRRTPQPAGASTRRTPVTEPIDLPRQLTARQRRSTECSVGKPRADAQSSVDRLQNHCPPAVTCCTKLSSWTCRTTSQLSLWRLPRSCFRRRRWMPSHRSEPAIA